MKTLLCLVRIVLRKTFCALEKFQNVRRYSDARFNRIAFLHDWNNYPRDYTNNSLGLTSGGIFPVARFMILQSHPQSLPINISMFSLKFPTFSTQRSQITRSYTHRYTRICEPSPILFYF